MRKRSLLLLVPLALGCSSASSAPSPTASGDDTSPGDTVADGSIGDSPGAGGDATDTEAGDAGTPGASEQTCAACTATDCLPALEACGSSQACLNALQAFNACYGADPAGGATCGATLASTGSAASTLWSCLSSKCRTTCG
jgi:hypothetical protein